MLAGYAMRITAPERAGRALAIAMAGIPLALAAGTPLGTWFGATVGWRWAFAGTSLFTVVILVSALILVPDAPGQHAPTRIPPLLAAQESTPLAILAIILWGLGFGGSATQLQTAAGAAAGEHADAAISMVTTAFNVESESRPGQGPFAPDQAWSGPDMAERGRSRAGRVDKIHFGGGIATRG
jgi:predicted MFS family arabinose efflux permease